MARALPASQGSLQGASLKWGLGLHLAGIGRKDREERRIRGIKGWVHEAAETLAKYGDVEIDEQANRQS